MDAKGQECSPAGVAPVVRVEVYGGGKRARHQAKQARSKIVATLWPHPARCMECAMACRSEDACFVAADAAEIGVVGTDFVLSSTICAAFFLFFLR